MPFPLVPQSTPPEEAFKLFLQFVLNTGLRKLTLIASEANPTPLVFTPLPLPQEEGAQLPRRREPNLRRWIGIRDTYQKARSYIINPASSSSNSTLFHRGAALVVNSNHHHPSRSNNLNPSESMKQSKSTRFSASPSSQEPLQLAVELSDSSSEDEAASSNRQARKRTRCLLTPVEEPALKKFFSSSSPSSAQLLNDDMRDVEEEEEEEGVEDDDDEDLLSPRISVMVHSTTKSVNQSSRFSQSHQNLAGSDPSSPVSPVTPSDHPPEPPKPEDPLWDVYQMQGLCLSGESAY